MATQNPLDKLMDLKAERAALGAMLIDPYAIGKIDGVLQAGDFHDARHQWLFEALRSLYEEQINIDPVTVANRLEERGKLREFGGMAAILELSNATPTSMHVERYGEIVARLATLRRLIAAAGQIAQIAYQAPGGELSEVLARAQALIEQVSPDTGDDAVLLWLKSLTRFIDDQAQRQAEAEQVAEGKRRGYLVLPWKSLERFNVRLRPGTMAILAAGSSVGKTTFLECCAEFWARQGYQVAFFHLELSHQHMLDRRAARLTGIPLHQIEDGILDARINDALAMLYKYPGGINYVHCPGWSASRIVTYARQLHNKGRCDVAIVDYLQKMRLGYRPGINKADALGDAVETLKTAAELLDIPVLLASQFNRAAQYADRKTGDFIRGSGEPHEKGNVVITLDRDILNDDMMDAQTKLIVAQAGERSPILKVRVDKNTSGPTGDTELIMNAARFLILDAAREELIL